MFVYIKILLYICNVFFMVLDLWLGVKIGCRETTIPILYGFSSRRNEMFVLVYQGPAFYYSHFL